MSGSNFKQLQEQLSSLKQQMEEARKAELPAVIERIKAMMLEYSISPEDLGFRAVKAVKAAPLPPKFRHPETGAEWNGKGRAPVWAKTAREAGTLESMRIQSATKARRTPVKPAENAPDANKPAVQVEAAKEPATSPTKKPATKQAGKTAPVKKAATPKATAKKAPVKKAPAKKPAAQPVSAQPAEAAAQPASAQAAEAAAQPPASESSAG